jgi:tetratricopeptide (TPR) repeat protein
MKNSFLAFMLLVWLGVVLADTKVDSNTPKPASKATSFLQHQDFECIRNLYRIKVDVLMRTLERTAKKTYLKSVAEDVLAINSESLLGHLALVRYYTMNHDDRMADHHQTVLINLIDNIKKSGDGSTFSPYIVSTLVEADEFIYVGGYKTKGKLLFLGEVETAASLELLLWNDFDQQLHPLYFKPKSINILFKQLDSRVVLERSHRVFYLLSELSRLEEAARMAMVLWLYKNEHALAGTAYTERLINQIKRDGNLSLSILATVISNPKIKNAKTQVERNVEVSKVIDELLKAREEGYTDAGALIYMLGNILPDTEKNHELYQQLLEDSAKRGGPIAKYILANQMAEKDDKDMRPVISKLYYESFRDGYPPSGMLYIYFHVIYPDLEQTVPSEEVLRKLVELGQQRAMVSLVRLLLENANDGESIDEALSLLERLKKYELDLDESNEIAWIYATDSRAEVRDLDEAVRLIKSAYKRFKAKEFSGAFVDTMARVLAELGDYCNAVEYQKHANSLFQKKGLSDREMKSHGNTLSGYQARLGDKTPVDSCALPIYNRTEEIDVVGYPTGIYRGETVNGTPSGSGRFEWDDGDVYVGTLANGSYTGTGTYTWSNDGDWSGHVYIGNFQSGKRHGMGYYYWPNGDIYLGNHNNGAQTGWGVAIYSNGARYDGNFVNGMQQGEGVYQWPDGTRYIGSFDKDAFTGSAELHFTNGNRFKGQLVNGEMEGEGVFTWLDGTSYEGEFKGGTLDGKGVCRDGSDEQPCFYKEGERIYGENQ